MAGRRLPVPAKRADPHAAPCGWGLLFLPCGGLMGAHAACRDNARGLAGSRCFGARRTRRRLPRGGLHPGRSLFRRLSPKRRPRGAVFGCCGAARVRSLHNTAGMCLTAAAPLEPCEPALPGKGAPGKSLHEVPHSAPCLRAGWPSALGCMGFSARRIHGKTGGASRFICRCAPPPAALPAGRLVCAGMAAPRRPGARSKAPRRGSLFSRNPPFPRPAESARRTAGFARAGRLLFGGNLCIIYTIYAKNHWEAYERKKAGIYPAQQAAAFAAA